MSREHRAEALSVRSILHPSTIAVIGASRRRNSIGSQLLDRLVEAGFTGSIHPVNPNVRTLRRRTAYPSVAAVPGQVDLAVIAVPAHAVLEVVDECAEAGVKALLVVSSGFAEEGRDGERLQAELLRRARDAGMRVVGPELLRADQQRPGRAAQRVAGPDPAAARAARPVRPVRRARHRGARVGRPPQPRHLDLRVGRQPGRRVRQRLHAVLDRRRRHRRRRPLPGVDGQPAQVLPHRAQPGADQAGHRREVRASPPSACPRATGCAAPRRAPRCSRRCSSRPASSGSRTSTSSSTSPSSSRHQPLPAGDRVADRRQLHRPRHAHRRRVHELGAHRVARPGGAAHRGDGRAVPHGARRGVRRPRGRLGAHLLHPAAGHQRRGRRRGRARCRDRF